MYLVSFSIYCPNGQVLLSSLHFYTICIFQGEIVSIFRNLPKKSLYQVSQILVDYKYESILSFLEETDEGYYLNNSIGNISPIPTYQFAVACTIASLGNPEEAEMIFENPEEAIAVTSGENVSRDLFKVFMS